MTDEVRVTSETGGQKGSKPCQLFSLPPYAMTKLGEVYGHGAEKYEAHNYRKGYPLSLSINAAFRHLLAWLDGQDDDPESELPHLAHAAWHMLTALQNQRDYPEYDDRYKPVTVEEYGAIIKEHYVKPLKEAFEFKYDSSAFDVLGATGD